MNINLVNFINRLVYNDIDIPIYEVYDMLLLYLYTNYDNIFHIDFTKTKIIYKKHIKLSDLDINYNYYFIRNHKFYICNRNILVSNTNKILKKLIKILHKNNDNEYLLIYKLKPYKLKLLLSNIKSIYF